MAGGFDTAGRLKAAGGLRIRGRGGGGGRLGVVVVEMREGGL